MRYLSVCSGIEAASAAWHDFGWTPVGFSEIEAFPSAVLAHRFPHVPNFGDMTKYKEWPLETGSVDLLVGGTPCFVAGTLILTKRGLLPIEQVVVGDEVVTHLDRWKRVVRIGSKMAPTRLLKGQGHYGLVTTDEHPFYASKVEHRWNNDRRSNQRVFSEFDWIEAKDMAGRMWAMPTRFPETVIPDITLEGRDRIMPEMTVELMRLVGAWVGDGWVRDTIRPHRVTSTWGIVVLCAGFGAKTEQMRAWIKSTGLRYTESEERTTTRFSIHCAALTRWLTENFGKYAEGKTIPSWLLGSPLWMREAFLEGYLGTDGFKTSNGYGFSTVSKKLAVGISMLIQSTRRNAITMRQNIPKGERTIEGRKIKERPSFSVVATFRSRSSIEQGDFRLGLVRKSEPTGITQEVFNVEVEDDHSYLADGVCVHNCQSFSVAGLRKGLADPRGNLMLTYLAIADHFRIPWLLWENVPGVLSSNGGRDFGAFLGALGQLGFRWSYRVLDAQHMGVPQRRRRVFVVANLGNRPHPAEILFEPESLRGNPAASRKARKGSAAPAGEGVDECGLQRTVGTLCADTHPGAYSGQDAYTGRLIPQATDLVTQSHIAGPLDAHYGKGPGSRAGGEREIVAVCATGSATEDGTGRGTPIVPVAFHPTQDPIWSEDRTHALSTGSSGGTASIARVQPIGLDEEQNAVVDGFGCLKARTEGGGFEGSVMLPTMQVRRLTPTECERLQGFPVVSESVILTACCDQTNKTARVAVQCHRWLGSASSADDTVFPLNAEHVGLTSSINPADHAERVVLVVRRNSVTVHPARHRIERSKSPVLNAEPSSGYRPHIQAENTAQELARAVRDLVTATELGRAESHQPNVYSSPDVIGNPSVASSGLGMAVFVADAPIAPNSDTYTISDLGKITPKDASTQATLCCFALRVIAGCIPDTTLPESFSFQVIVESDWTDIPFRGKAAADGPRYKALGNSMAVPVMRWIGQRIKDA